MGSSDVARGSDTTPPESAAGGVAGASEGRAIVPADARGLPRRPSLANKAAAPVLVKIPPPLVVRVGQLLWVLSLFSGGAAVVYLFVIRTAQLPEIADVVRRVDATRVDATYTTVADIIYWSIFGALVVVILVQITLQVSFSSRRPNVRWWQLGTVLVLGGILTLARELVAIGERGTPLTRMLLLQVGLATLGLLFTALPPALRWTARRHDVRRGPESAPGGDL